MNRRVIKSILRAKFNDWVKTITDPEVKALVEKNSMITGGAIASLLLNEPVKDYDIYFTDKATTLAVANYYVDKFNKTHGESGLVVDGENIPKTIQDYTSVIMANITPDRVKIVFRNKGVVAEKPEITERPFEDVFDALAEADTVEDSVLDKVENTKERYRPVFLSPNAITLSNQIQLVVRFYGKPDQIHENYDFVHCTNYWTSENGHLELKADAMEALLTKQLRYIGSKYPICSVIRTRKFLKRGFNINAGQYLKMLFQVSQLNLNDVAVLEDQLVGVDSAYFNILLNALKAKKEADPNFDLSNGYISTLIDRIF